MNLDQSLLQKLLTYQENEITEYHIYKALAQTIASEDNKEILMEIAEDELGHYKDWKEYTQQDVKPNQIKIWFYYWISRLFGITFGIKLMERGEEDTQENYSRLKGDIEGVDSIIEDENDHEDELLKLLDEKHLRYVGSIVLGLNDALVELTGALAGLTLASKYPIDCPEWLNNWNRSRSFNGGL